MLELRVLSGFHRGATLPLDGEALAIGADEDGDVVLADPGLAACHATLSPKGTAWLLEAADGRIHGAEDNTARQQILLGDGTFARVGPIWVTVCAAARPWQDPPATPVDQPPSADGANAPGQAPPPDGQPDEETVSPEPGAAKPAADAPARKSRRARMFVLPLAAVAVLSGAAAYGLTTHPTAAIQERDVPRAATPRIAVAPPRLTPLQLQSALRKRLAEIDVLSRVTLELNDRQWEIRGALNEEEGERLQRMLRSFAERHAIDFPVKVRIGSPESMLPFRIVQVIDGSDPSIVTEDGQRLYVGDEYLGMRLKAVAGNQLRFTGKQNLDIVW